MPLPAFLTSPKTRIGLKVLGIICSLASGFWTTFQLMWHIDGRVRIAIVYTYLTMFAVLVISAELNLMSHRHFKRFGRFLTTFVGRSLMYIFMGGLLLEGTYGWVIGMSLVSLGVLNVAAQCMCSTGPDGETSAQQIGPPI